MKLKIFAPTLIAVSLVMSAAEASIQSDMQNFFNGTMNYTSPDSVKGQQGGYYNGGSLVARTPVKNLQLASINLPKFGGGCSGIDAFFGSFSMISSDQLTALSKAIANNAGPFAFKLALGTLSPLISEKVGELQELANKINQMQINSCETAQAAVAAVWPWAENEGAQSVVCKAIGRRRGTYTDYAAERYHCDNNGEAPGMASQANSDSQLKDVVTLNKNIVWSALMKNGLFSSDISTAQLIMTLSGTVINNSDANQVAIFDSRISNIDDVNALLHGGTIVNALSCNDTTTCLSPTTSSDITITATDSFVGHVKDLLTSMRAKAITGTALTAAEQSLISSATVPVYKMLLVDAAYNRGTTAVSFDLDSLAEVVAVDVLYNYLEQIIGLVRRAVSTQFAATNEPKVKNWYDTLQADLQILHMKKSEQLAKTSQSFDMIQKTMQLEEALASQSGSQIGAVMNFTKALK